MHIHWWDKAQVLLSAYCSLFRLPKKWRLPSLVNPIDSTRYTEFSYFLKFLRKNNIQLQGKVLDVASPHMMAYVLSNKADITVIKTDINPEEGRPIRNSERIYFQVEDGTKLSFPDNTFECVYSISVIEHIYKKYTDAVREMIRVCKPGGLIYLSFPVSKEKKEEWLENTIYSHQYTAQGKTFFQYRFGQEQLSQLLTDSAGAQCTSQSIYWERHEGSYDRMTRIMRHHPKNRYIRTFKMGILNMYYGFFLLENKPTDFSCAKGLGNVSLILKKLAN